MEHISYRTLALLYMKTSMLAISPQIAPWPFLLDGNLRSNFYHAVRWQVEIVTGVIGVPRH